MRHWRVRVRWTASEPFHDSVIVDLMHLLRKYSPSGIGQVDSSHELPVIQVILTVDRPALADALVTAIAVVQGATGEQVIGIDADLASVAETSTAG
jgi:hypothetical protein